ncbi:MAG: M3 family metallopeptidase [Nitrococcus sp.]|nr:M3 family metallopeptidase [Nitrococcus sp.]
MNNPVLDTEGLPRFTAIRPEHVEPAIEEILADNRRRLDEILARAAPPSWENTIEPLESINDRLSKAWSPIVHMNAVVNNEALRTAHNACLPKISEYHTEQGQNERLFRALGAIRESDEFTRLDRAQQQTIHHALRDFRLAGVALPAREKARFKVNAQRLAQLASKFEENLLDASNSWQKVITDPALLAGLPQAAQRMARQAAEREGQEGWRLTLDFPIYHAVMTYAEDRALRRELYEAWNTRASDAGPDANRWDNQPIMEEILALRHEQARLLGLQNYAELSLQTKMARSTGEVLEFLEDLAKRSHARALSELAEVRRFAREAHGLDPLEAWDIGFYSEKLRHSRFQLSAEDLRPYFPIDKVLTGLFAVVERLYGIRIAERTGVETWHADVRFHEIRDAEGELQGQFYTDLHARANKRGGAWMDECRVRWRTADGVQTPVAYLTCNLTPPAEPGTPALLTHEEVLTLFHEFGHGLHHMLTQVDWPSVSGINGVPWDAVELPSQLMENWAWERPALDLFASHYQSGATLPAELLQQLEASRNFQSAMQMVRQIEFALFDFRVHLEPEPPSGTRIYQILDEVRQRVAVLKPPAFNRFPSSFAHIFGGGYAAGYYSYKWAEVLSADAYSRFEEEGIFNPQTGRSFLGSILEKGGSEDAMVLFEAFRGRKPSIEPLLRQSGLAA